MNMEDTIKIQLSKISSVKYYLKEKKTSTKAKKCTLSAALKWVKAQSYRVKTFLTSDKHLS